MKQYLNEKKDKSKLLSYLIPLLILGSILIYVTFQQIINVSIIDKKDIHIVKSLSENILINGIGQVEVKHKRTIPITDDGQVTDVLVRPGQFIEENDILAIATNYELVEDVQTITYKIEDIKIEISNKQSELKLSEFELQSNLEQVTTLIKKQKLEIDANKSLKEKGIVSKIKYQQSLMSFEQLKLDKKLAERKLDLFTTTFNNQVNTIKSKLRSTQERLSFLKRRVKALTIRAPFNGILSEVNANVGQTFQQGESLFEIIKPNDFIAAVQIPQYSSSFIIKGLEAIVQTPNGKIRAIVEHLDSVVRNGSLKIYLEFKDTPEWLKLEQSVEASIITNNIVNKLYVAPPSNFSKDKSWQLYKVNPNKKIALKQPASFDVKDSGVIYIQSEGLNPNDLILLLPHNMRSETIDIN